MLWIRSYWASENTLYGLQFSSVQSHNRIRLFATPWTAAGQTFLSITNSRSSLKLVSIELVMPSSHLVLCCPLSLFPSIFPSIRVFSNKSAHYSRWPKYWSFTSASVPPINIQGWFSIGSTRWISLQSKGLSGVFISTIMWSISSLELSFLYGPTLISVHDYWKDHGFKK